MQNRVVEIRKLKNPDVWQHVPSEQNPADLASRGCKTSQLKRETKWWEGPSFLKEKPECWPRQKGFGGRNFESNEVSEIKKNKITTIAVEANIGGLDQVIPPDKYSDLNKLLRVTGYVLKFIVTIRGRRQVSQGSTIELPPEEVKEAENLWVRHVQQYVREDKKYEQLRASLGLVQDEDGILRCRGRL